MQVSDLLLRIQDIIRPSEYICVIWTVVLVNLLCLHTEFLSILCTCILYCVGLLDYPVCWLTCCLPYSLNSELFDGLQKK